MGVVPNYSTSTVGSSNVSRDLPRLSNPPLFFFFFFSFFSFFFFFSESSLAQNIFFCIYPTIYCLYIYERPLVCDFALLYSLWCM